jgi:hypothetical protein
LTRRRHVRRAAFDSTGLDCGRRSYYYVRRRPGKRVKRNSRWPTVGALQVRCERRKAIQGTLRHCLHGEAKPSLENSRMGGVEATVIFGT